MPPLLLLLHNQPAANISNDAVIINIISDSVYIRARSILDTWADDALHGVKEIKMLAHFPSEVNPVLINIFADRESADGGISYEIRDLETNFGWEMNFVPKTRNAQARGRVAELLEPKLEKHAADIKGMTLSLWQLKEMAHAVWLGSQLVCWMKAGGGPKEGHSAMGHRG